MGTGKTREFESLLYDEARAEVVAGAAGPDTQDLIAPVRVRTVNPDTEDGFDFTLVIPRTVETDVATITLTPVVRYTAVDTPGANTRLAWKCDYTLAAPALVADPAEDAISRFLAVSTLASGVTTLSGAEYRSCLVKSFPSVHLPAANGRPSQVMLGQIRISSAATCGNSIIAVLSVGCAFTAGPNGANSILP